MPNRRRYAREVALRVLYQVDVGKHAPADVWGGALDQIRIGVTNPIHQLVLESKAELARVVTQAEAAGGGSARRELRHASRAIGVGLDRLHDEVVRLVTEVVRADCALALHDAEASARGATDSAIGLVAKACQARGLDPTIAAEMEQIAASRIERIFRVFVRRLPVASETSGFAVALAQGVVANLEAIDARLAELAAGWALDRQPAVDRNIMRLGAAEMLYLEGIPAGATINEAVELAKTFSTQESGRFVNGVLGTLAAQTAAGTGGGT